MRAPLAIILAALLASCNTQSENHRDLSVPPVHVLSGDYQRIQGTWTVIYNEVKQQLTPELFGALHIYQGDRFRLGDDPPGGERFIIDETHDPKWIDFDDGHPPRVLGIYKLEGDRLIVCTGDPGEPRPIKFETSPFTGAVLTRLERH